MSCKPSSAVRIWCDICSDFIFTNFITASKLAQKGLSSVSSILPLTSCSVSEFNAFLQSHNCKQPIVIIGRCAYLWTRCRHQMHNRKSWPCLQSMETVLQGSFSCHTASGHLANPVLNDPLLGSTQDDILVSQRWMVLHVSPSWVALGNSFLHCTECACKWTFYFLYSSSLRGTDMTPLHTLLCNDLGWPESPLKLCHLCTAIKTWSIFPPHLSSEQIQNTHVNPAFAFDLYLHIELLQTCQSSTLMMCDKSAPLNWMEITSSTVRWPSDTLIYT